jgi:hypothetical protein
MAANGSPDKVPILDFMVVRAPDAVDAEVLRRRYIHDDVLLASRGPMTHVPPDLNSVEHVSIVGKLIFTKVFCGDPKPVGEALQDLLQALLALLPAQAPVCEETDETSTDGTVGRLLIRDLERHAYIRHGGRYYILPDRLERLAGIPLVSQLVRALPILESERSKLDGQRLVRRLEALFDGRRLHTVLFDVGGHSADFVRVKRALFDALYLLYVLRRWTSINLEHIMSGLRTLHVLEAVAIDRVYERARAGPIDSSERALLATLASVFPTLQGWDLKAAVPGFPLIGDGMALEAYLTATPVVHPIFARLFWYAKPFNDIKPIGIGDLKVVKQWLTAYREGEISDIHNIMMGESKTRAHRQLEKTEETFSFTSAQEEETTKDNQSTDRFELKREVDNVVKSTLSVNANLNVEYRQPPVVVTVGAGFAYNKSNDETTKTAQNFWREVVSKAVSRIQTRTTEQRSVTKLFETEEKNDHVFSNVGGKGHVSGIYRWVDKHYTAQLFNYGKRMMFEFVVPEPAAFLVESRLRTFESALDYPQPPVAPTYKTVQLGFKPADINEDRFQELRAKYDLDDFSFPRCSRTVEFIDQASGQALFHEKDIGFDDVWYAKSFECRLDAKGYEIVSLRLDGGLHWRAAGETRWRDQNLFKLTLDGRAVWDDSFENTTYWARYKDKIDLSTAPFLITDERVTLTLGFQDIVRYTLAISAELRLSAQALLDWQTKVYKVVHAAESKAIEAANRELKLGYDSRMSEYRNRIAELKTTAINDLLQGGAEAANRELILAELKRQCLALITKEFDADATDDVLTDLESMGARKVSYLVTRLKVDETQNKTTVGWETSSEIVNYPTTKLDVAQEKGRYIQFLEQAFEWRQLTYMLYPYFWSTPPKWIQLMARTDDADPNLTAFLQAGAARVLVAVTPAYDNAVLHFLATREPWEGGPAPMIGDPLYIPLHEELRKQQDDRYNAVPEGEPWEFTIPTSLVYLHKSSTPLPELPGEQEPGP